MPQSINRTGSGLWLVIGILTAVAIAVVVIAGILFLRTIPAVTPAREVVQRAERDAVRRAHSMNNLKLIALEMLNYSIAQNGTFPARAIFDKHGKPLLSWRVQLLPLLEEQQLYDQFHLDEPWDSAHNRPLIARIPTVFANPNRPLDGKTNYMVPTGKGMVFDGTIEAKMTDITDGASYTLLVVESDEDRAVIWTKPDDLEVDLDRPLDGLGGFWPGIFLAATCDSAVHIIPNTVDPNRVKALFTRTGGETLDWEAVEPSR